MEWSFIYHVLCWFKFPKDWFDLIMSCITSANLSVLVNGERLDSFSPSRGIRQDDPLSPYLFILYMEYPAALIETEKSCGNWTGIKTSREGPIFSQRQNVSLLRRFSATSIPAPVKKLTQANSKSFSPLIQKSSTSPSLSMSWECIAPTVLVNILECPSSRTGETKELSTSSSIKSEQSSLPGRLDPYP